MTVLYDLVATQPLGGSVYHGGGEYAKAVFEALVESGYSCDALYDSCKDLDPRMEALCEKGGIKKIDLAGRSYAEACKGYDTFFTALPYGKFGSEGAGSCRIIATVHGTRSLEMPSDSYEIPFYLGNREYKRIAKALFIRLFPRKYRSIAGRRVRRLLTIPGVNIITVSGHTKFSLLNFFPSLDADQLRVCYSPLFKGSDDTEIEEAEGKLQSELGLTAGEYYLALGSGRWLKNNLRLAGAFDKLVSDGRIKGRKLVMTGGSHRVYKNLKNPDSFVFLNYVESSVLEALFKNARGLLYPSLNEGFGYPPLQAMKYGTPVLASAFSAVTEVCGDAALYANPYSEDEIGSRILMLEDDEICGDYAGRGPMRFKIIASKQKTMLHELLALIFQS